MVISSEYNMQINNLLIYYTNFNFEREGKEALSNVKIKSDQIINIKQKMQTKNTYSVRS